MKPWFGSADFFGTSRKSPGQKSEVRTHALEMELDHDSGCIEGKCLKGQFSGRALSSLSHDELLRLLEELRVTDSQGAFLIKVYFDRRSRDQRAPRASSNPSDAPAASPVSCCDLPTIHFWPPPRHAHAIVAFKGTLSGFTQVSGAEIGGAHACPRNGTRSRQRSHGRPMSQRPILRQRSVLVER